MNAERDSVIDRCAHGRARQVRKTPGLRAVQVMGQVSKTVTQT